MSSFADDHQESNGTGTNSIEALTKKPRASRACDACRKKKVKCDNEKPACSNCVSYGYECTYLEKQKKRGPQPSYPKALEDRLERLESVLSNLAKRNTTLPSDVVDEFHSIEQSLADDSNEKSDDSVEDDFGKLALEDPKYFSYVGSSSGFYLLDGGSFYKQGRLQNVLKLISEEPLFRQNPLSLGPGFPPLELREALLNYFFEYINCGFPIFPLGRLDKSLIVSDDLSELLYNCILTIAAFHSPSGALFPSPEEAFFASRVFQARAKNLLDRLISVPSIGLVQALILLSLHPQNGWMYLGMAIRLAQELGLHRTLNSQKLDPLEREKRKFLWWNCMLLDRGLSSFLGRPLAIQESDCNTSLPLLPENLAKETSMDIKEFGYTQRSVKCYILSIRLSHIMGRILREIYTAENTSQGKTKNSLRELNKALNQWEATLPSEFKYDFNSQQNDCYSVTLCFLHCYTLIILNRPFIPKTGRKASVTHPSQLICAKAASAIIYSAYYYVQNRQYSIQMQTGPIFTACSVHLINSVSDDPELARISKANLKAGYECLQHSSKNYLDAKRCLALLDDLIKSYKNINLEDSPSLPELYNSPNISFTSNSLSRHIQRHDSESLIIIPEEIADRVLFNNNPSNSPSPSLSSVLSPNAALSPTPSPSEFITASRVNNVRSQEIASMRSVNSPCSYMSYESPLSQPPVREFEQPAYSKLGGQENFVPTLYQSPSLTNTKLGNNPNLIYSNPVFPIDPQRSMPQTASLFPNSEIPLFPDDEVSPTQVEASNTFDPCVEQFEQNISNAPTLNPLQMDFNFEEWSSYINQFMSQT
ncbi:hypothetical protein K7432_013339 [Basidiobolus ranarum]|uniref:Zn(2)-C6 fungal-type domain-containing protein n=1 Tax=Basidiobolus ranarum TaxID=34480 RepID=A0ABR2WJF8_9FUNG